MDKTLKWISLITLMVALLSVISCAHSDGSGGSGSNSLSLLDSQPAGTPTPTPSPAPNQPLTLSNLQTQPLTCVFQQAGSPNSTAVFDPVANTVTTTTGNPATSQTFSNITVSSGLQPYGNNGITFVAFGDVPLFSVSLTTNSNTTCSEHNDHGDWDNWDNWDNDNDNDGDQDNCGYSGQTIVATWNLAPGGPQNVLNAGTCQITGSTTANTSPARIMTRTRALIIRILITTATARDATATTIITIATDPGPFIMRIRRNCRSKCKLARCVKTPFALPEITRSALAVISSFR